MIDQTYYQATARALPAFEPALGDIDTAVAIIGGGFAGIGTALGLAERGERDVVVLEAEGIGHGASGRNGGFVFGGWSLDEAALWRKVGPVAARRLYQRTLAAVRRIRTRIERHAIACDAVDDPVLWCDWFADPRTAASRVSLLREQYGVEWQRVPRDELGGRLATRRYSGAWREPGSFHCHPLDYVRGAADVARRAGVRVCERSRAIAIRHDGTGWRIDTGQARVRAGNVVLACGGYLAGLDARIDRAILPIATYVMATAPLGERLAREVFTGTRAAIYDTRFAFDYYRPLPDTRILWGGRISISDRAPSAVAALLKRDLLRVFPQLSDVAVEFAWSGLMGYPTHQMPQLRQLEPGLWSAQGLGGHGFAAGDAVGDAIAEAIVGGESALDDFKAFGLASARKPAGLAAAQLTYWWLQARDAMRRSARRG